MDYERYYRAMSKLLSETVAAVAAAADVAAVVSVAEGC